MRYQDTQTGEIKTYGEIVSANKQVSYPRAGASTLAGGKYRLIVNSAKPDHDTASQKVVEIAPVNYTQAWEVQPLTQDEISLKLSEQEEFDWAEYRAAKDKDEKDKWIAKGKPKYTTA